MKNLNILKNSGNEKQGQIIEICEIHKFDASVDYVYIVICFLVNGKNVEVNYYSKTMIVVFVWSQILNVFLYQNAVILYVLNVLDNVTCSLKKLIGTHFMNNVINEILKDTKMVDQLKTVITKTLT
jgi:hypothetical protein